MNRRIFPLNINSIKTWNNWKNYLNWLDSEINSINDYLNYWNPNYRIYGNSLYVVDIISGKEELLEFSVSSSKKDIRDLNWREGIFFPSSEDFISGEKLKAYTTYFPKMWTHKGLQNNENELVNDLKFYFKLASPIAALYWPSFSDNQVIFNYIENGQKIIGTNLLIPLEFSPSRYFLTEKENAYWNTGAIVWNEEGVYWNKTDSEPVVHISNIDGQVWSNNYPLMHECYIRGKNTNSFEEFIFDNDFSTEITNIANHSTVLYNINAKNITSSETESWNDFVYVKII